MQRSSSKSKSKSNKMKYYSSWKEWRKHLTHVQQAIVYEIIDKIMMDDGETTFVSQSTIALNINSNKDTVSRNLTILRQIGIAYISKIKGEKWNKNCYKINWQFKFKDDEFFDVFVGFDSEQVMTLSRNSDDFKSISVMTQSRTKDLTNNLIKDKKVIKKKINQETQSDSDESNTHKKSFNNVQKIIKLEQFKTRLIDIFNNKYKKRTRSFGSDTNLKKALNSYSQTELILVLEKYSLEFSNNIDEQSFQKYLNFRNIYKPEVIQRIIEVEEKKQTKNNQKHAKDQNEGKIWVAGKGYI